MDFTNKTDILIFYANAIDTKGEDGSKINGCSVHYLFWGEQGTALVGQSEPDVTKPLGMQRGKSWVDYAIREKIRIAPAIYEGTFSMSVGSDGKAVLKLIDVAYKSNVRMQAYILNGLHIPGMLENQTGPTLLDLMEQDKAEKNAAASESGEAAKPEEAARPNGKK
jgi:hypothetical protein